MHVTSRGLMQSEKISLYTPSGSLDLRGFCHEIFTLNQKLAQIVVHTQWIISIVGAGWIVSNLVVPN